MILDRGAERAQSGLVGVVEAAGARPALHLLTDVATEPGKLVRMRVTAGFPFWDGSTWEWELGGPARASAGTGVLFRHYGFGEGYAEIDFAHTAQTWALILARLAGYAASGQPQPFFPAPAA